MKKKSFGKIIIISDFLVKYKYLIPTLHKYKEFTCFICFCEFSNRINYHLDIMVNLLNLKNNIYLLFSNNNILIIKYLKNI